MWHPEGSMSVGIEGSQFGTNPLPPFPCRWNMWLTSPLEHPLRNSRLSLTQAHLTCGCTPSYAPGDAVVSTDTCMQSIFPLPCHPVLHPWHLMTLISWVSSFTRFVQTSWIFHLPAYQKEIQHRIWSWEDEWNCCSWHRSCKCVTNAESGLAMKWLLLANQIQDFLAGPFLA